MKKISTLGYIFAGYLFTLLCIGYFIWATYTNEKVAEREGRTVRSALDVLKLMEDVLDDMQDIETGQRGYVISGNSQFLLPYKDAFNTLSTDTSVLHSLVLYDSTQKEDLQQLFVLVAHKISHSRDVINARQKFGYDSAAALIKQGEGMLVMDSIRNLVFKIEEKDRLLLQHSNLLRQEISENTSKRFFTLAASFFLLSIVSFLLIYRRIKKGKKSETLLRYNSSLLTNIHDPIFSTDKQFNVTSWNKYAEQLYGWTEQEMKGKYFIDVLNVKYTGTTEEEVAKKYFAEGYWSGEVIHQKRNGELIYVIVSSTILKDTEGQMSGCVVVVQDITERKLKEKQIEYLASLVDQTGDAIISFGRDTLILSWNKGAENMYGFSRDEVVGKSYPKVVRSNITPEEMNRTEKTLLEKGSWQGENIHYRKDGTSFYCLASATVVRDKDGAVNECVMIVRDITERKKLETQILSFNKELQQQVVEKTHELTSVFERITDAFIALDKNWRYTYLNTKAAELHNCRPEDLIGKNIWEMYPDVKSEPLYDALHEAMASQKPLRLDLYYSTTGKWFEDFIYPSPEGVSVYYQDITDKKNAELELQLAHQRITYHIDNSPLAVIEWSAEMVIKKWSERAEEIFGWRETEVLGKSVMEFPFIFDEDKEYVSDVISKMLSGEVNRSQSSNRNYTKSGSTIFCEWYTSVLKDNNGQVITLLSLVQDITDKKKAEQQIITERDLSDIIINSLPGIFYLTNKEGKFLRWNKNFEEVSGCSGPELEKIHALEFFSNEEMEMVQESVKKVFRQGNAEMEAHFITRKGEKLFYYFNGWGILYMGQPCLIGMGINIEERKKAEEQLKESEYKYRLLFNNNPMPMWMFTIPERRFIDVNEAAILHYGYSREEFLKMHTADIRPEEDAERYMQHTASLLPGINYAGIWKHEKKNGDLIDVDIITHDIEYEGKHVRLVLANDVTEQLKAEESLKESHASLRELASYLQNVREQERTNIAREIHDELGQQLTGLKMDISWLSKKTSLTEEQRKEKIKGILELIDIAINTIRRISAELRPSILDDLGLVEAMQWQTQEFEKRSGIKSYFHFPDNEINLPSAISTSLFRIYQESLTNVARHSEASEVKAYLNVTDSMVTLRIMDNGKGFDSAIIKGKKTLGLLGMKERTLIIGGNYQILTKDGGGTEVVVSVPFEKTL